MKARWPRGTVSLQYAARKLRERGFETGEKIIFDQLRAMGLLDGCEASAKALQNNFLRVASGNFTYGEYNRVFLTREGFRAVEEFLTVKHPDTSLNLGNGSRCNLDINVPLTTSAASQAKPGQSLIDKTRFAGARRP